LCAMFEGGCYCSGGQAALVFDMSPWGCRVGSDSLPINWFCTGVLLRVWERSNGGFVVVIRGS